MAGLRRELRLAWQRTWGGRLFLGLLVAAVLFVLLVRFSASAPAGAVHSELARLQSANEVIVIALSIVAVLSAYRLFAPDLDEEFESLSPRGGSHPLSFAAGRALVGAGGLLLVAGCLGIVVEALDTGGRYQPAEALHVAVLFANSLPLFVLAMTLTCVLGRFIGLFAAFFMQSCGADAAYQRGALADGFITPGALFSAEQFFAWLAPRPLLDPLPGIALRDQSEALLQFPVWEGHAVWGTDLTQVSGIGDVAQYGIYLVALSALLYLACRRRGAQARSRAAIPGWFAAPKADSGGGDSQE